MLSSRVGDRPRIEYGIAFNERQTRQHANNKMKTRSGVRQERRVFDHAQHEAGRYHPDNTLICPCQGEFFHKTQEISTVPPFKS